MFVQVGDLVYIIFDGFKMYVCNWYFVVFIDGLWCNVCKFIGLQLCFIFYCVKLFECYCVFDLMEMIFNFFYCYSFDFYFEDIDEELFMFGYVDEEFVNVFMFQSILNFVFVLVFSEFVILLEFQFDIIFVFEFFFLGGSVFDIIDVFILEFVFLFGLCWFSCFICCLSYFKDYVIQLCL